MNLDQGRDVFPFGVRKILLYYLGYCGLFLIFHLSMISLVSFFHFLLDHDMGVIENWLYRNAWEMIIFSKGLAAFVTLKALKLNNYSVASFLDIVKNNVWKPTRKVLVLLFFFSILFYALVIQFGGELINNARESDFAYISYLGSSLFYLVDVFVIYILMQNVKIDLKKKMFVLNTCLLMMFILFTKATLPYINKYFIFLILHFVTLISFFTKEKQNIINPILYALVIVGPLSSLYGVDIVWDNAHSVYTYDQKLPLLGISGIWLIGLGYYYKA